MLAFSSSMWDEAAIRMVGGQDVGGGKNGGKRPPWVDRGKMHRYADFENILLVTKISHQKSLLKMIFLFPRWDVLVPWRVMEIHTAKIRCY